MAIKMIKKENFKKFIVEILNLQKDIAKENMLLYDR